MDYEVIHKTIYQYSEPVTVSQHAARLTPRTLAGQAVRDFRICVHPQPEVLSERTDYFGNTLIVFGIRELHQRMEVEARSRVEVLAQTPPVPALSPVWSEVAASFRDPVLPEKVEPYEFCLDSPMVRTSRVLADWARVSFPERMPLLQGVADLTRRIYSEFAFDPKATEVATPLEEAWEKRHGVCQDFAHIAIASLRSLGLAARYVSGYLRTIPPPGQPRLQGVDASHAWVAVFCPLNGWVEFDPTNNLIPAEGHVRVAVGRDYSDVSPLSGVLTGGGEHVVGVSVDVIPLETGPA
jgi:transglutaminase-like putative cysteine protease